MAVGTVAAITTAVSAIGSTIANNVAKKQAEKREEERQQSEVARVSEREDSSVSRGTRDALAAGIDPRVNGSSPVQAGAQSVDPPKAQVGDYSELSAAGANIADTLMQQQEIDVNRNLKVASLIEKEYQDQYAENKSGYQRAMELCNNLVQNSREIWASESVSSVENDGKIIDRTQNLTAFLANNKFELGTIKHLLDSTKINSGTRTKHIEKDTDKESVGANGDIASTIVSTVDNVWQGVSGRYHDDVGTANKVKDPRIEPHKNPYTGAPEPGQPGGWRDISGKKVIGDKSKEEKVERKRNADQNKKSKGIKLSGGYENIDEVEESSQTDDFSEKLDGENKDTFNKRYLTNEERREIVSAYIKEYSQKLYSSNKESSSGVDFQSRQRFAQLYSDTYEQAGNFRRVLNSLKDYPTYFSKRWSVFHRIFETDFEDY